MANYGKIQAGDFSSLKESHLYAPACRVVTSENLTSCWAPAITRLLAAGYSFLGNSYTENGFLFRGMESGITDSITTGYFGHFNGSREESRVERVMDICFLTHEIRDALTVADMGNNNRDSGILVIPAAHFNQSLTERSAAFMAIGDSGMVFNYPFLTEKILVNEITVLVVPEHLAEKIRTIQPALGEKLLIFDPCSDNNNEETLRLLLLDHGFKPSDILPDTRKPRKDDLIAL